MEVENKEENLDMQNMPTLGNADTTGSLSEEPVTEEVVVEEPLTEEVVAEEPLTEEVVAEEPLAEEVVTEEVGEPVPEEVESEGSLEESEQSIHEPRQLERADRILKDAGNFRKKINTLKKRLPTLDDDEKDQIRNGVIREFINVLKVSKPSQTRKRFGRRINNLRNIFHESLNLLNGTAKKHPRRKSRKQKVEEPIPTESTTFSEPQL